MKISIITATYNSQATIEDTLNSVLNQTYKNIEHIIIDGKSKDNTMKIVKKYEKKYDGKLKYISEKDKGLYDAMNKGIKMAKGDIIGILNSDDVYANNLVLETIVNKIKETKSDGCYGNLLYMDENLKKPIRDWKTGTGKIKSGWMPAHPTFYISKKIYKEVGFYNLNYKVVSDFDFMIRVCKNDKYKLTYIDDYLVHMRLGGVSSAGIKGYIRNIKEANKALKDNGYKFSWLIILKRIFITIKQYFLALFKSKE